MKALALLLACQVLLASQVTSEMFEFEKLLKSMDSKKSASGQRLNPIPRGLLNEFSTYLDRLMASDLSADPQHKSALRREMEHDYNELRNAASNEIQERAEPLKPGQVELECSKTEFGCCPDDTPAPSSGKEGCALRLCSDVYVDTCNGLHERGELHCEDEDISKKCPFSCGRCKLPAPPLKKCEIDNPGAFCCWDGNRGTGSDGRRCRPCSDLYGRACRIFKHVSRGCESNAWRIRNFMQDHCPQTCGLCHA